MITTINEWRKANENQDTVNTTHFERIWDGMSFEQKEDLFGDEIGDLFDESDNYDKEAAVKFFNTKWNDIDDKYYNRLKNLMQVHAKEINSKNEAFARESLELFYLIETVIDNQPNPNRRDISRKTKSISAQLEPIIPGMAKMTVKEIKDAFTKILNNPDTQVSDRTRKYWLNQIALKNDVTGLMILTNNLYLAGANMAAPGRIKDYGNDRRV